MRVREIEARRIEGDDGCVEMRGMRILGCNAPRIS